MSTETLERPDTVEAPMIEQEYGTLTEEGIDEFLKNILGEKSEKEPHCEIEAPHSCTHKVTHRVTDCEVGVNICRAFALTREAMIRLSTKGSPLIECAHCRRPIQDCWRVFPI